MKIWQPVLIHERVYYFQVQTQPCFRQRFLREVAGCRLNCFYKR